MVKMVKVVKRLKMKSSCIIVIKLYSTLKMLKRKYKRNTVHKAVVERNTDELNDTQRAVVQRAVDQRAVDQNIDHSYIDPY